MQKKSEMYMGERKQLYKGQLCKMIFVKRKMSDYTERGK